MSKSFCRCLKNYEDPGPSSKFIQWCENDENEDYKYQSRSSPRGNCPVLDEDSISALSFLKQKTCRQAPLNIRDPPPDDPGIYGSYVQAPRYERDNVVRRANDLIDYAPESEFLKKMKQQCHNLQRNQPNIFSALDEGFDNECFEPQNSYQPFGIGEQINTSRYKSAKDESFLRYDYNQQPNTCLPNDDDRFYSPYSYELGRDPGINKPEQINYSFQTSQTQIEDGDKKSEHVSRSRKPVKGRGRRKRKSGSAEKCESEGRFEPTLKKPHENSCERCWRFASPARSPVNKPDQKYDPNFRRGHSCMEFQGGDGDLETFDRTKSPCKDLQPITEKEPSVPPSDGVVSKSVSPSSAPSRTTQSNFNAQSGAFEKGSVPRSASPPKQMQYSSGGQSSSPPKQMQYSSGGQSSSPPKQMQYSSGAQCSSPPKATANNLNVQSTPPKTTASYSVLRSASPSKGMQYSPNIPPPQPSRAAQLASTVQSISPPRPQNIPCSPKTMQNVSASQLPRVPPYSPSSKISEYSRTSQRPPGVQPPSPLKDVTNSFAVRPSTSPAPPQYSPPRQPYQHLSPQLKCVQFRNFENTADLKEPLHNYLPPRSGDRSFSRTPDYNVRNQPGLPVPQGPALYDNSPRVQRPKSCVPDLCASEAIRCSANEGFNPNGISYTPRREQIIHHQSSFQDDLDETQYKTYVPRPQVFEPPFALHHSSLESDSYSSRPSAPCRTPPGAKPPSSEVKSPPKQRGSNGKGRKSPSKHTSPKSGSPSPKSGSPSPKPGSPRPKSGSSGRGKTSPRKTSITPQKSPSKVPKKCKSPSPRPGTSKAQAPKSPSQSPPKQVASHSPKKEASREPKPRSPIEGRPPSPQLKPVEPLEEDINHRIAPMIHQYFDSGHPVIECSCYPRVPVLPSDPRDYAGDRIFCCHCNWNNQNRTSTSAQSNDQGTRMSGFNGSCRPPAYGGGPINSQAPPEISKEFDGVALPCPYRELDYTPSDNFFTNTGSGSPYRISREFQCSQLRQNPPESTPRKYAVFYMTQSQNKKGDDVEVLVEEFSRPHKSDLRTNEVTEKMKKIMDCPSDSMALRFQKGVSEACKAPLCSRILYF